MVQRILNEKDRSEVESLWDYCFEKKETPFFQWFFKNSFRFDRTIGSFEEDRLKSMLNLAPYLVTLRGNVYPSSYIVGVATWPEYRGKGEVRRLLAEALTKMDEWDEPFAILMPSRPEFYFPFDFRLYHYHLKYRVPMDEIRLLVDKSGTYREATVEDISKLNQLYERTFSVYDGRALRNRRKWLDWLEGTWSEGGKAYLLLESTGGEPEGYLFYHLENNTFKITDWAAISQKARFRLMQFAYQHRAQAEQVEWDAPLDDPFQYLLPVTKDRIFYLPFMTARIVNLQKLLPSLELPFEGRIIMEVKDSLVENNQGTFLWQFQNGMGSVEKTEEPAGLKITIGGLSQWVFGQMNSRTLSQAGFLEILSQEQAEYLDRCLPLCAAYINEYF